MNRLRKNIEEEVTENLVLAIQNSSLEIIDRLFLSRADVNAAARNGAHTALQATANRGCLDVVRRLLEADAEVNTYHSSPLGCTALQLAAEGGHLEVVRSLLAATANVNVPASHTYGSYTELQAASRYGHPEIVTIKGGYSDTATKLQGAGLNLHSDNRAWLSSAVDNAARHDSLELIKVLFTAVSDANDVYALSIDVRYSQLEVSTALFAAAENGHFDIVKELLKNGADPTINYDIRSSARVLAIGNGHFGLANNGFTGYGTTIDAAAMNGHFEIVKMLIEYTGCGTPLTLATTIGHADVVKLLVDHQADINKNTAHGTASAASNGHLAVVSCLVKTRAIAEKDMNCSIVFTIAASNKNFEIVNILLQNEATIHWGTDRGIALFAAVENCDLDIIDKLITAGAIVNGEFISRYCAIIMQDSKLSTL
ncbi:ankyrin repeat-containing domain protein [Xylaria arbuscula]|nr:ankyrin repeat-containing domain protein [Xylaria arbuscula]